MAPDTPPRIFFFGDFEADAAESELRRHGLRVKLHFQPFQVLLMLLERPSEVVTRDEMRLRLWGQDTFVDFDHGLNSAVNRIREALHDSAARPRYIETVSGKGYRFIAPVSRLSPAPPPAAEPPAIPQPPPAPAPADDPGPPAMLSTADDLPAVPRRLPRTLLLLLQALYLGIYLIALANLREVDDLFLETRLLPPVLLTSVLVVTACALIPVRLYLAAAVAFDLRQLPSKFARLFPALLLLDLLWALSPFLLVHYISAGLALGMTAILIYLPFSQRSLVLMYGRDH